MPDVAPPTRPGPAPTDAVRRLLADRRRDGRPDVAAVLSDDESLGPRARADVVLADQRERWQAGERVPAEWYLDAFPDLARDDDLAVDLIFSEYLLRDDAGEAPDLAGVHGSFPPFRERPRPPDRFPQGARRRGEPALPAPSRGVGARARRDADAGLRADPRTGLGRYGRRLRGPPDRAQSPRCPQDGAAGPAHRSRAARPVPPRGRGRRPAPPPEHRRGPRDGRARGPPLFLARARRGRQSGEAAGRRPCPAPPGRGAGRDARPRDPLCAREGHHPSRPEAGEYPALSRRPAEGRRLRPGQGPGRRGGPDADRHDPRLPLLHVARAGRGEGQRGRPGGGRLLARGDPLRAAHRGPAVPRGDLARDAPQARRRRPRAAVAAPRRRCRATSRRSA